MNWYRIRIDDGDDGYTFCGSTADTLDELMAKAEQGAYIRLDDLVYHDRGEIKSWSEWDKREIPSVAINPRRIVAIVQFKGDPRTLEK